MLQEVGEIWRATGVQGFEGQGGKFKPYTPFDREPVARAVAPVVLRSH